MNTKPLGPRVLIQPQTEQDQTKSGIILPDSAGQKKSNMGVIVEVGDVEQLKVGDKVIFSELDFEPVEIEKQKYFIGVEDNVLAIITEDETQTE